MTTAPKKTHTHSTKPEREEVIRRYRKNRRLNKVGWILDTLPGAGYPRKAKKAMAKRKADAAIEAAEAVAAASAAAEAALLASAASLQSGSVGPGDDVPMPELGTGTGQPQQQQQPAPKRRRMTWMGTCMG